MYLFMSLFSMVSQWLSYSTVNLTLSNILEICQHGRWAQHHHKNSTCTDPCMDDKMHTDQGKSNLVPILQHWNRVAEKKNHLTRQLYSDTTRWCIMHSLLWYSHTWISIWTHQKLRAKHNAFLPTLIITQLIQRTMHTCCVRVRLPCLSGFSAISIPIYWYKIAFYPTLISMCKFQSWWKIWSLHKLGFLTYRTWLL